MSRKTKKWLIAGACLVLLGAILFAGAMTVCRWDFSALDTGHYVTNAYEFTEGCSSIALDTERADILFAVSEDDAVRVVCFEDEKAQHAVYVEDGTLTVRIADTRAWYEHIGISTRSPKLTVYLPGTGYASIAVKADTGDVEISAGIRAENVTVSLTTGDIRLRELSADTLELSASTGEITVSDVTCTGDVRTGTTTGDVHMTNVTCRSFLSTGSTGCISLNGVIAAEKLSIERSTGDVLIDGSDAAEVFVKTATGDVTASFLTEKTYAVKSRTGNTSVPQTTGGGRCEITTSTGDIEIR